MAATEYNTGFDDAQSVNNSTRDNFIYKDISLYFTRNPVTSDVTTVTDIQDIKRAVRHIVLLNPGEKPFHPEIGTGVRAALFQNFTAPIKALLSSRIQEQLRKYEPRVEVTNVSFNDNIAITMVSNFLGVNLAICNKNFNMFTITELEILNKIYPNKSIPEFITRK